MKPEESVKAFQDLGAEYAFGIHWGTFKLTLETLDELPLRLKKALASEDINQSRFRSLQRWRAMERPFWNDRIIPVIRTFNLQEVRIVSQTRDALSNHRSDW